MKIILIETLEKVGKAGQVINVKNGFARNYLLPKKYAVIATEANLKKVATIEADAKAKVELKNIENKKNAEKITTLTANFTRKAEEDGKLFGSVSENDIIKFLSDNGIQIVKSNVVMEKHIKNTGDFEIKIVFNAEISADLKISVVAE
jgi:large subunit ribosomal protein L9